MKQTLYFLLFCLLMSVSTAVIAQPANDDCVNASPISLPSSGVACVNGSTIGATDFVWATGSTCGQSTWPSDVWYSFVSTGSYTVISLSPTGSPAAQRLGVAVWTTPNCINFTAASGAYCDISATN